MNLDAIYKLVANYNARCQADPLDNKLDLMRRAATLLESGLREDKWSFEVVRIGTQIYDRLNDKSAIVDLLTRYLRQKPAVPEEAWARWHLIDNLAMLRRCHESVAYQREFLAWARATLPQPMWYLDSDWPFGEGLRAERPKTEADHTLLLHVMNDATQALCWREVGMVDDWLRIFDEIMAETIINATTRANRRYYLRTGGMLCAHDARYDALQRMTDQLEVLSNEDPLWPEAFETQMDVATMRISLYHALGDTGSLLRVADKATSQIKVRSEQVSSDQDRIILRMICHNTAAALYQVQNYKVAIPLFEQAVALRITSPYTYLWLAACLWRTMGQKEQVLDLLRKAAKLHGQGWNPLADTPEFKDIAEDHVFMSIFSN